MAIVKVLIVDDSAFMRNALRSMITSDPEIQVVGMARNGLEAIAQVKTLKPDLVTLDIEMPRMDGITALKHIMAENPLPVIMVSSLTTEGARETLEALELGALDFIPKNLKDLSVNILKLREILVERIKHLARKRHVYRPLVRRPGQPISQATASRLAPERPLTMPPVTERATGERRMGLLAIGTSTGGPKALQAILPALPSDFPVPVVVAQHMPPNFTGPFAERLDQLSALKVKEAVDGETLMNGTVYIAPGGKNMRVRRSGAIESVITISESREEFIYCPSVDALMQSASEAFPGRVLGVMLTGMGHDGLDGARAIKAGGGRLFAQDEATCVVYGMPRALVDAGIADKVLALEKIAGEILNSI
jgi:two-component system chemotaxis response regulator CheB